MQRVTLFRDFADDRNVSMEVYADNLAKSLRAGAAGERREIVDYTPVMPAWTGRVRMPRRLRARYARYVSYPVQAKREQGTVNHVIDQAYAHLVTVVDRERTVVTVHDLIPLLAWVGAIPGFSYPHYPALFKLAVAGLRKARLLIAVSESTKKDLIRYAGISESRIVVIHNGVDDRFRSRAAVERARLRMTFGLPDRRKHVVLISGAQPYKNAKTSLRVVASLQRRLSRAIQLVWLGAPTDHLPEERLLRSPVIRLSGLSADRVPELYNAVDCLLFPSLYEGFGWPPLEAMASGTPVVTSDVSSLPEVVGDAAMTAAPTDAAGLVEALLTALEDDVARSDLIARGLERAKQFSWSNCADRVNTIYDIVTNDTRSR